jgi:hypothetical protein
MQCAASARGLDNITTHNADVDGGEFPSLVADRAWCRWVLSFINKLRDVLERLAASLRSESIIVLHEYFDYSTWRAAPQCLELEEFVSAVMASWRASGGEPDVALSLPRWIEELGFKLRCVRPIIDIVQPSQISWAWLKAFIEVGRQRLVDLGYLSADRAEAIWQAFTALEARPKTWSRPVCSKSSLRRAEIFPGVNMSDGFPGHEHSGAYYRRNFCFKS